MEITRINPITKTVKTLDLDITNQELLSYQRGALIQHAFPNLDADEREFFKTGIAPDDWLRLWPDEETQEQKYV